MSSTPVMNVMDLMRAMPAREASDLHLVPGHPPCYRIHGRLHGATDQPLAAETVREMVLSLLPDPIRERLARCKSVDCSVSLTSRGLSRQPGTQTSENAELSLRFRVNVFFAREQMCACLRFIPNDIPDFEWMGFPRPLAERIVNLTNGLVIITGITGSGKTTTLAALVNLLNREHGARIITVEEPIEYLFPSAEGSLVTQREVGIDVDSFYDGLRSGLRQDPNVILVGEIRDRETAQMAISAAETGHLILTTMHTQDAKGAITRLVDLFPSQLQSDVRSQLSLSLRYVIAQHLLASAEDAEKRALALEVLVVTHGLASLIRQGRAEAIDSAIQTGRRAGMVTLDDSLAALMTAGKISPQTARHYAKDPESLNF